MRVSVYVCACVRGWWQPIEALILNHDSTVLGPMTRGKYARPHITPPCPSTLLHSLTIPSYCTPLPIHPSSHPFTSHVTHSFPSDVTTLHGHNPAPIYTHAPSHAPSHAHPRLHTLLCLIASTRCCVSSPPHAVVFNRLHTLLCLIASTRSCV